MRVLTLGNMYPPHHQGGYERAWASVVEHMRDQGHHVSVLTTTHRQAGVEDPVAGERDVSRVLPWYWQDHAFPTRGALAVARLERRAHSLLNDEIARTAPDVVACFSMGGLPLSLIAAAERSGLPVVAVVHDEWLAYGPKVDPWTRLLRRRPRIAPILTRVVGVPQYDPRDVALWSCNSAFIRDRARLAGVPLPLDRTTVDQPGIDAVSFAPASPREQWSGRLLAVGRIVPEKGLQHAIAALAALPGARLTIVGTGDQAHRDELDRLAARLELTDRVTFTGPLAGPELRAAYADADAVVFPVTWSEPFGLVPLEAMSVGRPVVATATGGAAEYLRDGENALVVAPADAEAIADAVRALERDASLRERLRRGGATTAERFTERAFAQAVALVIERAASPRS